MRRQPIAVLSILAVLFLAVAGAALAADLVVGSDRVSFPAKGISDNALTVSLPDGTTFRKEFRGSQASFSLFDKKGNLRPDGLYTWELTAIAAPATGDRKAPRPQAEVLSGSFTIRDGAVVDSSLHEGTATKDQVINDDLIVTGSVCAGFDCVNGESFGFDTLRLKENNLRIKFQDTSSTASFPTRDWQLTANDTTNGGAEKFSIDDIDGGRTPFTIRAGAPSNSLYVNASGNVGLGTATPVVTLHVVSGNTPTLRLEQNGSQGFTAQTWDVAGNEANYFIRDATNGSTLPFRLRPGAPSSAIDIAASGNVGIGASSPTEELHVRRTDATATRLKVENTNAAGNSGISLASASHEYRVTNDNIGNFIIRYNTGAANVFSLASTGTLTITGNLISGGPTCGAPGCDRLFQSEIESIEEHAAFMWENSFLREVGPTPEAAERFNLTEKMGGILSELEKAHIYIDQLNKTIKLMEQRLEESDSKKAAE